MDDCCELHVFLVMWYSINKKTKEKIDKGSCGKAIFFISYSLSNLTKDRSLE